MNREAQGRRAALLQRFSTKEEARQAVWDALVEQGVARFPFPPHGRIPNFAGAHLAAERLVNHPVFHNVRRIKANPDAPQRLVRELALRRGITVYVGTPRLREGFKVLDPAQIPPAKYGQASTLTKGQRWARDIDLIELPPVDLIVQGSVAVTREGHRCGKGHGDGDLEYAILRELGHPPVPVVTTVHPLQVLEAFPVEDHDLPLSVIAMPEDLIEVDSPPPAPAGIDWRRLPDELRGPLAVLRERVPAR